MKFIQEAVCLALKKRRLLCQNVQESHSTTLSIINNASRNHSKVHTAHADNTQWTVILKNNLLFDVAGLKAIKKSIDSYQGTSEQLRFKLRLSPEATRDYYSHSIYIDENGLIELPITATRASNPVNTETDKQETLHINLNELSTAINYPLALTRPDINKTPLALLMPYGCAHDCLFANQIALFSQLNTLIRRQIKHSPMLWLSALLSRKKNNLKQRLSISWKQIHPQADIHHTAIIEGSIIGEGCRVGAHCVVRYSVLGKNVQLHDGAKVEYSVVDDYSWLMHDLVLYRALVEKNCFLIHGPYQFSYFQKESAAFANIMMDYRPDDKPIRVNTPHGVRDYKGRFLGALLEERAKVFGGTLTAPGITIPEGQEISCDIHNITTAKTIT